MANILYYEDIQLVDGVKGFFGTGEDLKIYHDGSASNIVNETGNLLIEQKADDGDIIFYSDDGAGNVAQYFRLDGGAGETWFSRNTRYLDGVSAQFGTNVDLKIYHDGSNSYIDETGTGSLYIKSAGAIRLQSDTGENMIYAVNDGAVNLYYNNVNRLQTTSAGAAVTGTIASGNINISDGTPVLTLTDTSSSATVTHTLDGVDYQIANNGTSGNFKLSRKVSTTERVFLHAHDNGNLILYGGGSQAQTISGADTTFTGVIIASAGSKGSPAITFTGDLDTGIYREGANDLAITAGGSTALLANSTGIGIPDYIYHIGDITTKIGFSAADTFIVRTADTERFSVNNSGFAGSSGARVTSILDEDNMASNSATALATQQSIKAYVDANAGGTVNNSTITLTAGAGLTGSSSFTLNQASNQTITFSIDIGTLTTTTTSSNADWFAISNTMGSDYKIAPGDIDLSTMNNDSGWTSNAGTVTGSASNAQVSFWNGSSSIAGDSGLTYNSTTNTLIFNGDYGMKENGAGTFELNADGSDIITKINGFGSDGSMSFDEGVIYTSCGFYVPSGSGISVGTTSTTSNTIRCTGNIIAYYSDERLKDFEGTIPNALDKVCQLNGYYYKQNKKAAELGFDNEERQVGVSAQEVEKIMPEVIEIAPISYDTDDEYLTVDYGKLVPLLIESIKELKNEIEVLKNKK